MPGNAPAQDAETAVIDIRSLSIGFTARAGTVVEVLKDVNLTIRRGESVGLVGESGSGKSTLALAAMGFLKDGLRLLSGQAYFDGRDMFDLNARELCAIRGGKLGLVPQNSGQSLTPTLRVGCQIEEALRLHSGLPKEAFRTRTIALLDQVRLPDPRSIITRFPHELSGGQQQRVAIAMALAGDPDALLLDEPTTGLDVTTQVHILDLLGDLARMRNMAMVYVSHDLGVIARVCGRVLVMLGGEVVTEGPVDKVLTRPENAYAQKLLDAIPRLDGPRMPSALPPGVSDKPAAPLLTLNKLCLRHARPGLFDRFTRRPALRNTVESVAFAIRPGETLGLVGESGSGKSTILKSLAGLLAPVSGSVVLADGGTLAPQIRSRGPDQLRHIQLIFQNPDESLNPRHTVARILAQPLTLYKGMKGKVLRHHSIGLLEQVRLNEFYLDRLPRQLSGGEKQRVAIARAFAADPDLILCDEITSALDVSVQAAVLDLMAELRARRGTAYIFVSHDLAVVRSLSDRVAVLHQGRICEISDTDDVYNNPSHPYTRMLLDAVLEPTPKMAVPA